MRERPAARMNSKAPKENPFSACCSASWNVTQGSLARVGHPADLVADRVHRLPVHGLHFADVHVLDRVVGVLVELEGATRAVELHALERGDELLLVRAVAVRLLERLVQRAHAVPRDRKSTRLNSSHEWISYAVFCLKKKKKKISCTYTNINNKMKRIYKSL